MERRTDVANLDYPKEASFILLNRIRGLERTANPPQRVAHGVHSFGVDEASSAAVHPGVPEKGGTVGSARPAHRGLVEGSGFESQAVSGWAQLAKG